MGDNDPVKPKDSEKETRLSVRIPPALKDRLAVAAHKTGVDEPTIVRQCLAAFCDHVEMHGRVIFPLTIGSPTTKPAPALHYGRAELNESPPKHKRPL